MAVLLTQAFNGVQTAGIFRGRGVMQDFIVFLKMEL